MTLCLLLVALGLLLFYPLPQGEEPEPLPVEPRLANLSIRCVGDVMGHLSQIMANYDSATGTYDFTPDYEYIRPYIEEADLALCNVETTFRGGGKYTGYPAFNSPDQLAYDLASVGFSVAYFTNNHVLDTGLAGLERSLDVLRSAGLQTAGAHYPGEERTPIVEVEGLKVGLVAYTYETALYNGRRTLNGSIMAQEAPQWLNSYRMYALEEDLAAIEGDIEDARQRGADLVILYMHWGNEYQRKADKHQRQLAERLAGAGADIIFASHPHVVQEVEELFFEVDLPLPEPVEELPEPKPHPLLRLRRFLRLAPPAPVVEELPVEEPPRTRTRVVPVFYSMGNIVSNQRQETLDNRYTEQGMIAAVDLVYNLDEGYIQTLETRFIPTWVEKYAPGGQVRYAVIPLVGNYLTNPELVASGHGSRAKQALEDMVGLIGSRYVYDGPVH